MYNISEILVIVVILGLVGIMYLMKGLIHYCITNESKKVLDLVKVYPICGSKTMVNTRTTNYNRYGDRFYCANIDCRCIITVKESGLDDCKKLSLDDFNYFQAKTIRSLMSDKDKLKFDYDKSKEELIDD